MRPLATRDANDTTWYVLEYTHDFVPRTGPGIDPWKLPVLDASLFYDKSRHVLELKPAQPPLPVDPLPGVAIDVDGQIYHVDIVTGRILVRCGRVDRELVCERGAIASAAGMALDRRGLLYIADPPAHRVLVVVPDDGGLAGVLVGDLQDPVDVATAPNGRIYVADRKAGSIVVFNSRFNRCGSFAVVNDIGETGPARPIAVMIGEDGAILVADANFPRILRFSPAGKLLGSVEPHVLARGQVEGALVGDALEKLSGLYGRTLPRFYAGVCGPCRPARDGGDRLAAVHRAVRLAHLSLGHAFAPSGTWVSAALDGGTPGVVWHKIEIDADVPDGTWLKVQTVTGDKPAALGTPATIPAVGEHDDLLALQTPTFVPYENPSGAIKPIMPDEVPDRLVFSPPGRWLRLRLTLGSDGTATPTVRAVRVFYSRVSYLDLLPRVYRRNARSAFFLEHFLALFEHTLTGIENRYELFTRQLNPAAAPVDVLNWLGCLIDLSFDPSWPIDRRRALVAEAMELYATRGTPRGLARMVEIYTGHRPVIVEAFLERPLHPSFLGQPGLLLGSTSHLAAPARTRGVEELFLERWAHRFTVLVFIDDPCDEAVTLGVVDRIIRVNKPAHTVHTLRVIKADASVGRSQIGIDLMLGAREAAATTLGGCGDGDQRDRASVLGGDAILGQKRPAYARPLGLSL
jgi:phage tail-like protein